MGRTKQKKKQGGKGREKAPARNAPQFELESEFQGGGKETIHYANGGIGLKNKEKWEMIGFRW